jgi:hypothetical protein
MKTTIPRLVQRLLLAALGACAPLAAQDLPFSSGSTGADGAFAPAEFMLHRDAFAFAYDATRNRIVVYGGYGRGETGVQADGYKPETWTFDGTRWTLVATTTFVSSRVHARMVFDPVRNECVMFGGQRADGVLLNETWTWNGTDWTKKNPANSPEPRMYPKMVWDSQNNRVLLFGGHNPTGNVNYSDLWTWNGTNWTKLESVTTKPHDGGGTNYYYHDHDDMVWDSQNNRAILTNVALQRTHVFNGTAWSFLPMPSNIHPAVGTQPRMIYDPIRQEAIIGPGGSQTQTWTFKNDVWTLRSPANHPSARYSYGFVWHSGQQRAIMFNGLNNAGGATNTWSWDGTNWQFVQGNTFVFDMSGRASGVWNFTSINIPLGLNITFKKNPQNSPVTWLATENVNISGRLLLNGQDAPANDLSGSVAIGGPGGYDGGLGGVRFDVSGSYLGQGGQGPGGGAGGDTAGEQGGHGMYSGNYGNTLIQPLVGGSGGGGGAPSANGNGGNGGAGGGAIMIASSRDIVINGLIQARGGIPSWGGGSYGGGGSGGAIKLLADRISGTGNANADGQWGGGAGRVRLEAFYRPFATQVSPVPSATAPTTAPNLAGAPTLAIINVAGAAVNQPPTGSLTSPDIVFANAGSVSVQIRGTNIPSGTAIQLRLNTATGIIVLPPTGGAPVTLDATGNAVFNTVVPRGQGTLQALAEFTVAP